MENIVLHAYATSIYLVKYPMGEHLSFYATSFQALKDGIKKMKWSYKPVIYEIKGWANEPKITKFSKFQYDLLYKEIK